MYRSQVPNESEPADTTAAALQKHILDSVAAARKAIANTHELGIIEDHTRDFFRALGGLEQHLASVRADRDLSDEAKTKRRRQRLAEMDDMRREAIAAITTAVVNFQERHRDAIAVQPPERDPLLLEAKLGNARSDARMMFDAETVTSLPLAFHQHAASEKNPLLTYLLVGTGWGTDYLTARKAPPATLSDWEHRRSVAFPLVLTPAQREGFEAMKRLEKIESTLAHAYSFFVRDRYMGVW